MKKFLLFITILILSITLSGCKVFGTSVESNYVIDGENYISGFYEGLFTNSDSRCFPGDDYSSSDDIWSESRIDIEDTHGYEITFSDYDMYSVLINTWEYEIYVKESQFSNAKLYYEDYENYHYYVAYSYNRDYDYDLYEEIPATSDVNQNLSSLNNYSGEEQLLNGISSESKVYYIYKISNDGLFTSIRRTYYIVDNQMFLFSKCDASNYYGHKIESDLSDYFIDLINNNLK